MKILISGWGTVGDILPTILLGGELGRRSHEVHFIGNPCFKNQVSMEGLEFTPVGSLEAHRRLQQDPALFDRRRKSPHEIYLEHYYPLLGDYYDAAASLYQPGRTLLIGNELGARTLAEQHDIPWVKMVLSPAFAVSRYDPPHPERMIPWWASWLSRTPGGMRLLWRLNALRRGKLSVAWPDPERRGEVPADHPLGNLRGRVGLGPTINLTPRLTLCMWPDWYGAPQPDWSSSAHTTGFVLAIRASMIAEARAGYVESERPVGFTTGSASSSQRAFFAAAIEACRRLQCRGYLITTDREQLPEQLPSGIEHSLYVPFEELFPRAAMVVHHGGVGTSAVALAAGIPQLVCPLRGDQYDNANRLRKLGVAKMLDVNQITPERLTSSIRALLGSTAVAKRCAYWSETMSAEDGAGRSADLVEGLLDDADLREAE